MSEKRTVTVPSWETDRCSDCRYYRHSSRQARPEGGYMDDWCREKPRRLHNCGKDIPDWCPLLPENATPDPQAAKVVAMGRAVADGEHANGSVLPRVPDPEAADA